MNLSIIAYIALAVLAVKLGEWRSANAPTTFGSADWLRAWVASGQGLFRKGGLVIGDWIGLLPVHYRGSGHALTVAPTGAGKGVNAIIPNLLQHEWIFLLDPGGENAAIASRAWRAKDYSFFCLNPWGMHSGNPWSLPSHRLNPLDILDPASETFSSDAELLADMIVVRSGSETGSSAYFKDEARSGIRAFLMHIVTAEPKARQNLLTLREYISAEAGVWEKLIAAMKSNQSAGGLIAREAAQHERREAQAAEEFSAILSTMKQDTNFIEDPVMQRALMSSDVNLADLKGWRNGAALPGCVVSVVIPLEYFETHAAYARLMVGCALWEMQRKPLARGRVLFVLDEFPALKRMDKISQGLATLRKYRVWLWPVIQNLGQLKQIYGQNWQTFMTNAGVKQFMGAGDLETAQYVSDLCGEGTIEVSTKSRQGESVSQTSRRLATAQEIMNMSADLQIVFADNLRPMLLQKRPYWHRPSLRGSFNLNPYHAETPNLDYRTIFWAVQGAWLRFIAWLLRPSPAIVAVLLFAFTYALDVQVLVRQRPGTYLHNSSCTFASTRGARFYTTDGGDCPAVLIGNNWSQGG